MSDQHDTNSTPPEGDATTTHIEEQLEGDKGKALSHDDLEALRTDLTAHINSIRSDKVKDAEEKASDRARMEALDEKLTKLITAQEEKDRTTSDSTTIIVPPGDLNPPTHQNSEATTDSGHENQNETQVSHRKRGWKRLY
jgi:hypothetical protein